LVGSVTVDGVTAKTVYETTTSNGDKVRLYDKTGKAKNYANEMLQTQARLQEEYPNSRFKGIIVTDPNSRDPLLKEDNDPISVGNREFARVHGNIPFTFVNSDHLGYDIKKLDNKDNFNMPSSQSGNTKDMSYLLTHEFGHHVDFQKHSSNGYNYKQHPLTKNESFNKYVSSYGKPSPVDPGIEAYAEVFAEWHHSSGKTKNPAAIAMARYEGWYGSGVVASATISNYVDSENSDWYSMTMIKTSLIHFAKKETPLVVSDDFSDPKGGKKISGGNAIPPTKDEIAEADQTMSEVLKELGLEETNE